MIINKSKVERLMQNIRLLFKQIANLYFAITYNIFIKCK